MKSKYKKLGKFEPDATPEAYSSNFLKKVFPDLINEAKRT
jgi:hypothetical protein